MTPSFDPLLQPLQSLLERLHAAHYTAGPTDLASARGLLLRLAEYGGITPGRGTKSDDEAVRAFAEQRLQGMLSALLCRNAREQDEFPYHYRAWLEEQRGGAEPTQPLPTPPASAPPHVDRGAEAPPPVPPDKPSPRPAWLLPALIFLCSVVLAVGGAWLYQSRSPMITDGSGKQASPAGDDPNPVQMEAPDVSTPKADPADTRQPVQPPLLPEDSVSETDSTPDTDVQKPEAEQMSAEASGTPAGEVQPPASTDSVLDKDVQKPEAELVSAESPDSSAEQPLPEPDIEPAPAAAREEKIPPPPSAATTAATPSQMPTQDEPAEPVAQANPVIAALQDADAPRLQGWGPYVDIPVAFRIGSANKLEDPAELDTLGHALQHPALAGKQVLLQGYTDSLGYQARNLELSTRRVQHVKQYLVEKFALDSQLIVVEGKGEADPVATNNTPEGRRRNRRIRVVVQVQ